MSAPQTYRRLSKDTDEGKVNEEPVSQRRQANFGPLLTNAAPIIIPQNGSRNSGRRHSLPSQLSDRSLSNPFGGTSSSSDSMSPRTPVTPHTPMSPITPDAISSPSGIKHSGLTPRLHQWSANDSPPSMQLGSSRENSKARASETQTQKEYAASPKRKSFFSFNAERRSVASVHSAKKQKSNRKKSFRNSRVASMHAGKKRIEDLTSQGWGHSPESIRKKSTQVGHQDMGGILLSGNAKLFLKSLRWSNRARSLKTSGNLGSGMTMEMWVNLEGKSDGWRYICDSRPGGTFYIFVSGTQLNFCGVRAAQSDFLQEIVNPSLAQEQADHLLDDRIASGGMSPDVSSYDLANASPISKLMLQAKRDLMMSTDISADIDRPFHLAISVSAAGSFLYVNGVQRESEKPYAMGFSRGLHIGGRSTENQCLRGMLGEVRIWNYGRTQSQIHELMRERAMDLEKLEPERGVQSSPGLIFCGRFFLSARRDGMLHDCTRFKNDAVGKPCKGKARWVSDKHLFKEPNIGKEKGNLPGGDGGEKQREQQKEGKVSSASDKEGEAGGSWGEIDRGCLLGEAPRPSAASQTQQANQSLSKKK